MTKLIATGQGGALVTRDKAVYEKLRTLRNNGVTNVVDHSYVSPGLNFKYSDILASIGVAQMRRADQIVAHCHAIQGAYDEGLAGLSCVRVLPVDTAGGECGPWVEAVAEERGKLTAFLAGRGIQTCSFVPSLSVAAHLGVTESFPNADYFWKTGFMLPCGPDQPMENIARTIDTIREFDGLC